MILIVSINIDFAKNFAKCHNLFKYFLSHITAILRKDTISILQIKLNFLLWNIYFSGTRVNPIVNKCLND